MVLRGFKRQVRNAAVGAASFGMVVTGLVVTAPSAVAQESGAATWEMPDVTDSMLQNAIDATVEAAGSEDAVRFSFGSSGPAEVVYNYTNWRVCGQSPAAEKAVKITGKPASVYFRLARPGGC
ncbi:hypothetical protein [Mycolicibacterium tusciae]|uniref:hypothetical protein n=1 Tax=Mycolicibacterium tusciae TaxID=75922 RepID=UPI00024A2284|nr:hypothetical protein [Mycolicibacterium tusciae]